MTASTPVLNDWAERPMGKVARAAVAITGMAFATLVLMNAALVSSGAWALVLLGVATAATSVRVAQRPSVSRLAALGAVILAIPLSLQLF